MLSQHSIVGGTSAKGVHNAAVEGPKLVNLCSYNPSHCHEREKGGGVAKGGPRFRQITTPGYGQSWP